MKYFILVACARAQSACHGTEIKSYRNINRLSQILPAKFREKDDCTDSNRRNLDEKNTLTMGVREFEIISIVTGILAIMCILNNFSL